MKPKNLCAAARLVRMAGLAVMVVQAAACDDSDGGGGNPADAAGASAADAGRNGDAGAIGKDPGTRAATAAAFVDSFCESLKPCCQRAGLPATGAQCKGLLGSLIGNQNYNPVAGGQCLVDLKVAVATPEFCKDLSTGPSSCEMVAAEPRGNKKPGEACSDDEECAPSSEGDVKCEKEFLGNNETVEKCQLQIRGKQGDEPCVATRDGNDWHSNFRADATDVLARGYICDVSDGLHCGSETGACAKIQPIGGPCANSGRFECVANAYCDDSTEKCVARKAAGSDCSSFSQECLSGHVCDAATDKCTLLVKDGGACTADEECSSDDCQNMKCAPRVDLALEIYCGAP